MDLDRLARVLRAQDDVVVAYLFGSAARGTAGSSSDVDVAVLLRDDADLGRRHLELLADVSEAVAPRGADLLVLNEAPVAVAYRVLRDGRLMHSADDKARIAHWCAVVDRYIDMAPFRRSLEAGQRHRLREGRFGRP